MADMLRYVVAVSQSKKFIDKDPWVPFSLVTGLISYNLLYFRSFIEVAVISEERHELSTK